MTRHSRIFRPMNVWLFTIGVLLFVSYAVCIFLLGETIGGKHIRIWHLGVLLLLTGAFLYLSINLVLRKRILAPTQASNLGIFFSLFIRRLGRSRHCFRNLFQRVFK